MKMEIIRSKDNKTIKELKKLKQKKYRDIENKFLAEGIKFLDYTQIKPTMLIISEEIAENNSILEKLKQVDAHKIWVDKKIFQELSSQENSQGILILYDKKKNDINLISKNVVVLDDISDPGNLGTIIRVCDATKFYDIILTKGSVDAYNEKVVRASMGSILNVNLFYLEKLEIKKFLLEKNYNLIVTSLDSSSIPYNKIELSNKNAIILGNEGQGVSETFLNIANIKTIIPILGNAESLNVAIASSLILYKLLEIKGEI